jgi:hypothetical protein
MGAQSNLPQALRPDGQAFACPVFLGSVIGVFLVAKPDLRNMNIVSAGPRREMNIIMANTSQSPLEYPDFKTLSPPNPEAGCGTKPSGWPVCGLTLRKCFEKSPSLSGSLSAIARRRRKLASIGFRPDTGRESRHAFGENRLVTPIRPFYYMTIGCILIVRHHRTP